MFDFSYYLWLLAAGAAAYLLAGVNPSIIFSRLLHGKDIRSFGSGNPGFTNYRRTFGGPDAVLVMLLDILKVLLPTLLFSLLFGNVYGARQLSAAFIGLCAMLGHAYPVWYRFQGGKAFLAGAAAIWAVDWRVGGVVTVVFLLVLFVFKYASLAALTAGFLCPVLLAVLGTEPPQAAVLTCSVLSVALLFWRHKANLVRLWRREELSFFGKAKQVEAADSPKPPKG